MKQRLGDLLRRETIAQRTSQVQLDGAGLVQRSHYGKSDQASLAQAKTRTGPQPAPHERSNSILRFLNRRRLPGRHL